MAHLLPGVDGGLAVCQLPQLSGQLGVAGEVPRRLRLLPRFCLGWRIFQRVLFYFSILARFAFGADISGFFFSKCFPPTEFLRTAGKYF